MLAEPKITVLMPAYNAEKYIAEAINSVLDQTFSEFELLIVVDGATDRTLAIAASFTDERIVLIPKAHSGIADTLNYGLALARAPLIARFDADDWC
jgi:glycosyltransferase involved in cell wall biosynthesis